MANKIGGLTPQVLRPTAAPRDTFVQPNAGQGLGQLADSLSQLAPSLSRFGSVYAAEQGDKEKMRGENEARDFVEAHGVYKTAIEKGLIEKNKSPFYRIGAYETFGRASAYRYHEDMQLALAESDVAESTTPGDFDSFEGKFRQKWLDEHFGDKQDPYLKSAFGKQADALVEGSRQNFTQGAASRLEGQVNDSFQAEVHSIVKDGYLEHLKPEDVLSQIQLAMQRQINGHMALKQVNENVAQSIVSAAKRLNDVTVLDLMDKIKVGSGALSGVARFAKLREDAENEIASVNQNRAAAEYTAEERKKKEAITAVSTDFVQALIKDPTIDVKPFAARAALAGDPDKASTFIAMQKAFVDREYLDVPEVKQRLLIGVHTGYTDMNRLDHALAAKSITFQTYQSLADDVRTRDKEGRDKADSKLLTMMERVRTRTKGLFVAEFGGSTAEQRRRGENAASEAVSNFLEWRKTDAGRGAGPEAVEQWIHNEATRQFGLKGDPMDVEMLNDAEIPDSNFGGPKPVNPKKAPAVAPDLYQQLKRELETGRPPSDSSIRVMKTLGITNPKALKQFLDAQAQFMGTN